MYFATLKPGLALAAFLLQGALGNPVASTTTYAGTTTIGLTPTSASAVTASSSTACSRSICVDNINECGMMYGGCFLDPACTGGSAWPTFSKPPCPTTSFISSSSSTCTQSICQDFINECGQTYGGCFLDPKCTGGTAFPTFTKPPCPTITSVITSSVSSSACTQSICADYINSCGQTYGGCFLDPKCTGGSTYPTFTAPPCYSPTSSSTSGACTRSICVDNINECGLLYGGCFLDPQCTGGSSWPTFTKPPCPTGSGSSSTSIGGSTITASSSQTVACSQSICVDGVDQCGQTWGGCYLASECGGPKTEPSFVKPQCTPTISPTAVIIETVTRYTSNPIVTVTSTSTSKSMVSTVLLVPLSSANSTRLSSTSPTPSPSSLAFTGSAARNVAGFGILAGAVMAGALFL